MSQRSAHKHSMSGYNMSGWHGTHTAKMVSVVLTNQKCEISGRIVFKLDFDAELFWASLWTCFGLCLKKTSRKHSFIQVLPRENNYWSHIPQSKRTSYSNRPRQSCHTPCRGPPFSAFLRSPSCCGFRWPSQVSVVCTDRAASLVIPLPCPVRLARSNGWLPLLPCPTGEQNPL